MADAIVCYLLMKDVSESFPRGSLLDPLDNTMETFKLHTLHGVTVPEKTCAIKECDVAPVNAQDFRYLCRIDPRGRWAVFTSPYKLKWGKTLKSGDMAYARLRKKNPGDEEVLATVEVKWVGHTKTGALKFGVEIIEQPYRYQGLGNAGTNHYFKCAENCGLLLDLDRLENTNNHNISEATTVALVATPTLSRARAKPHNNHTTQKKPIPDPEGKTGADARDTEKDTLIAALQAQIQRELGHHKMEIDEMTTNFDEKLKCGKEIEMQLQKELMVKAENHAAELCDVIEHHRQEMGKKEEEKRKLIKEMTTHFQNEIKTAHHKWQQDLANTWEVDGSGVEISDITFGTGRLGTVMKGYFRGIDVAVKKFHPQIATKENHRLVCWHINFLAPIRHPNLLLFLGAVISDDNTNKASLIITELLDMSLCSAYQQDLIDEVSRVPILGDVAAALTYLHTNRVPIIHGDVSSSKVLLRSVGGTHMWKAKLSVFGLANIVPNAAVLSDDNSNAPYAAPEVISGFSRNQTDKVDVYSFGVLICEVVLSQPPPQNREEFPIMLSEVSSKDHHLFQLAMNCAKRLHEERPSMLELSKALRTL